MDNKQELLGGVLVDRDNEKTRGMERQSTRVGLDPTLLFLAPKGSWRRFQLVSKGVGDGEESGSSSTAARVLITAVQEIRGWEKKRCQNMSPWVSRRVVKCVGVQVILEIPLQDRKEDGKVRVGGRSRLCVGGCVGGKRDFPPDLRLGRDGTECLRVAQTFSWADFHCSVLLSCAEASYLLIHCRSAAGPGGNHHHRRAHNRILTNPNT